MLTVMDFLRLYEKSLEEGRLVPVKVDGEPVKVGQVRELATIPGERFLVLEEVEPELYLTVPMSSYLPLLNFEPYPPVFVFRGYSSRYALTLACVPVWDYLRKELIEGYSQKIGYLGEESLKRVKEWLEEVKGIDLPWYVRKFIRLNSMVRGGQTIPFAEYLWNVHSTGEFRIYRKTSPWFNPAEAGMVSAMNAREHARVFSRLYVCKGGRQEWTYSYTPEAGQAGLFHRGSIRAGIDERAIARAQDYAGQNVPSQDAMTSLALQTAKLRAPVKVQQGTLIYETSYNGQEGACSLVSVSQIVSGRVQAVHNYRVCGDRVEYVGESGLPALPQGIVQVKQDIARMCQKFGQAELLYEGTTIKCRALRDKDKCLVELTYLQGGKLVGKEEVDGCK